MIFSIQLELSQMSVVKENKCEYNYKFCHHSDLRIFGLQKMLCLNH